MGTKERRERVKVELREKILKVARHLAARQGWEKVTIRRIAEEIEYSPPTIYEFFENKEALLDELAREGFELLLADLQKANLGEGEPKTRLLKLMGVLWDFAWQHPELYQVIYGMKTSYHSRTDFDEAREAFGLMREVIHSTLKRAEGNGRHHHDFAYTALGLIHGLISLSMEGVIPGGQAHSRKLMEQAILDLLQGWNL